MDKWIMRNRSFEISVELSELLAEQTEFLTTGNYTPAENSNTNNRVIAFGNCLPTRVTEGGVANEPILSNRTRIQR